MLSKFYRLTKVQPFAYVNLLKQALATHWPSNGNTSEYFPNQTKISCTQLIKDVSDSFPIAREVRLTTRFFGYFKQPLMLCKNDQKNFMPQQKNPQTEKNSILLINQVINQDSSHCKTKSQPSQSLTIEQQRVIITLLAEILSCYGLDYCYRAEIYPKALIKPELFLRESTGFPPNREQQLKFKQLLEDLTKDQLINFVAGKIAVPIRGDDKKYNLPVIFIKAIDIAAFENKINKKLKEKHPITQQQFGLTETRLKN